MQETTRPFVSIICQRTLFCTLIFKTHPRWQLSAVVSYARYVVFCRTTPQSYGSHVSWNLQAQKLEKKWRWR